MCRQRYMIIMALFVATSLSAQEVARRGQVELKFTGGACKCFLDERFPDYWLAGGSMRFYVAKRIALEPEFLYRRFTHTSAFQDYLGFTAIPHLVFDFRTNNQRIQPYVLGGVGLLREREKAGVAWIHRDQVLAQGGVGAKVFLTRRVYLAPEFRAGNRQFIQLLGSIGFVLN